MRERLAGTRLLLRATLRHDGRALAPWALIVTLLSGSSVLVYPLVFPTPQDRAGLATGIAANPALSLIFGPARDLRTPDGFNAWRALALGGFVAGLGAIFTVTRATRAQEDSGQAELLASGVLGRGSRLLAGVGMGFIGGLLIGVLSCLVTVLCGGSWHATLLLAATFTLTAWMFTAIAAVIAQIGSDAHAANSMAVGVLGVLYMLRGFVYTVGSPQWTIWANPLGWTTETSPAVLNRWWPLVFPLVFTAAVLAIAFVLQSRREFGQGLLPPHPGPAHGTTRSPLGLALRLNRASLITWMIAFLGLGSMFGHFTTSVPDILGSNPQLSHILASGAIDSSGLISAFLVTILSLVGIIAAVPGVQIMLRVRSEEMADRLEPVVATSVSRARILGSSVFIALLLPALYVLAAGTLIAWRAGGAGIGVSFWQVVRQALATIPAVWTITAVSVAVVGRAPRRSIASWAGVLIAFVLTLLGPIFKLWTWILAISPFWHVPNAAAARPDWWGLVWISLVTAALLGIGFTGLQRRDLAC
ncbi:ABC transporter permease [Propionibacterium sp.]|uniref:ABC transporter permease n=1 Tax=Propionibacterium sp. TaxID=1977903 RepID=UPI0039E877FC